MGLRPNRFEVNGLIGKKSKLRRGGSDLGGGSGTGVEEANGPVAISQALQPNLRIAGSGYEGRRQAQRILIDLDKILVLKNSEDLRINRGCDRITCPKR